MHQLIIQRCPNSACRSTNIMWLKYEKIKNAHKQLKKFTDWYICDQCGNIFSEHEMITEVENTENHLD